MYPNSRAHTFGLHAQLVTPLLRAGVAIGSLVVYRRERRPFSDRQIALLETFADQVVIAIESARLFQELQERNVRTRELLDQTQAQEAEKTVLLEQAAAAETRLRRFLELAPDGVLIVDERGEIVLVNRQVEALFGYTREELLGQPVELLDPRALSPATPCPSRWLHARVDGPSNGPGYGAVRTAQRRQRGSGRHQPQRQPGGRQHPRHQHHPRRHGGEAQRARGCASSRSGSSWRRRLPTSASGS